MKLGNDTLNCLCRDAHPHLAAAAPGTATFDLESLFSTLWPYVLTAIQVLIASGVPQPTAPQVIAKCQELAAAGPPA
jgi:hypothetical protein